MSFRASHALVSAVAGAALLIACGARTGLDGDVGPVSDASTPEEASFEGGPLDVQVDCASPRYCDPSDSSRIYECGVAVFQCGSLEQCEERDNGAQCVNPCLDSLGNDTSNGCEFYAVEMDTTPEIDGVCYAVFVVNQWKTGEPAKIQVSLGDQVLPIEQFARVPVGTGTGLTYAPYDANAGLPANEVAILFLSRDPNATLAKNPTESPSDPRVLADCPAGVIPAVSGDAATHGTGIGRAFHIQTNVPVVAYQMLPYGGGRARVTASTLLVPTNAWDTNYLVADAYAAPVPFMVSDDPRAGPTTVIVASQDATTVTLNPTVDVVPGRGIQSSSANEPVSFLLNHGQYLQFTQTSELTGSAVQANRPVSVIGGSTVMDVPLSTYRADTGEQMLPPVRALGSEYVAARYRNRVATIEETPPWRIVGVVDGTVLTYDPVAPPGAPTTINSRQLAEFDAAGPFVVRSQDANHPFYFASYMTGGATFGNSNGTEADAGAGAGDPEFLNVVPPAQYLPRYTFFTDPTYPETNLVVVRARDDATGLMPDVILDCAGVLGGWTQVDTGDRYEMTRVDLSTGNFQGVGACNNGVHTIQANIAAPDGGPPPTARFGVTIWGWGNNQTFPTDNIGAGDEANAAFTLWVSYGYPAGANFKPLNNAILPAR